MKQPATKPHLPKFRTAAALGRAPTAQWREWFAEEARIWSGRPEDQSWPAFTPLIIEAGVGSDAGLLHRHIFNATRGRVGPASLALHEVISQWDPQMEDVRGLALLIRVGMRLDPRHLAPTILRLLRRPFTLSTPARDRLVDAILDAAEHVAPAEAARIGARLATLKMLRPVAEARLIAILSTNDLSSIAPRILTPIASFASKPAQSDPYLELAGRLLMRDAAPDDLKAATKPGGPALRAFTNAVRKANRRYNEAPVRSTLTPETVWQRLCEAIDTLTEPVKVEPPKTNRGLGSGNTKGAIADLRKLISERQQAGVPNPQAADLPADES